MDNIDIRRLCELANLESDPAKEEQLQSELQGIISMVEHLPEKVEDRDMLAAMNIMTLRKDEVGASLPRDELLAVAPKTEAGCISVPDVQN